MGVRGRQAQSELVTGWNSGMLKHALLLVEVYMYNNSN